MSTFSATFLMFELSKVNTDEMGNEEVLHKLFRRDDVNLMVERSLELRETEVKSLLAIELRYNFAGFNDSIFKYQLGYLRSWGSHLRYQVQGPAELGDRFDVPTIISNEVLDRRAPRLDHLIGAARNGQGSCTAIS